MYSAAAVSLLLVAGLTCFLGFSWAMKAHFRSIGPVPPGMLAVSLLTLAGIVWYVFRLIAGGASSLWAVAAGCFALSIVVFVWAIRATRNARPTVVFSKDEPFFLLHDGPYRYVRHPFYASYVLFWIGTAVATPAKAGWAAPALMLLVYAFAARQEEQKFARSGLADTYRQYRAKVGMFVPHLGSWLTLN